MDFAEIIREVGRGAQGARALPLEQATALFGALLDGQVPDLETGALLAALRMKGESDEELQGFYMAAQRRYGGALARPCEVAGNALRPVVLPSYNGARRQANLTPLLGEMLVALGVPVLIHGMGQSFGRVSSEAILRAAGLPVEGESFGALAAGGGLRFVPIERLAPGIARLLALRARLGLRNAAHSVVKLLDPFDGKGLVVTAGTHPPYLASMRRIAVATGANVLLLRATEGEPYANPRRRPGMELLVGGESRLTIDGEHESLIGLPRLPDSMSVEDTLAWGREVLAGRMPVPSPLAFQVAACLVGVGMAADLSAGLRQVALRFVVADAGAAA